MMQATMYEALDKEAIKLNNYGEGNHKTKCPRCQPPHNGKDRPLSITIENGIAVWNCHHCEFRGTTLTPRSGGFNNFVTRPKKIYAVPEIPKTTKTPDTLYAYFSERGISSETVKKKGVYIEGDHWIAIPYHDKNGKVVNIKYRTKNKKFKQVPNAKRTLYNYDLAADEDTVIFVEGEIDVLTLIECGYDNVVTLPDGAPAEATFNPKDARFTALENCPLKAKKIILFTDNDEAGKALHASLLHRFGRDMCWYADYPSGCKDANEILLKCGKEDIDSCIRNAKPYPVDGLYTTDDFYGGVLDLYNGNYDKPIEVGHPSLDEIYKVMRGTFHTITGIPNHGKSLFLDQMLIKISEKENWRYCIFSPEQSSKMHLRRLVQMRLKKSFDEGLANRMTKEELDVGLRWLKERFYFIETKETTPDIDYLLKVAKGAVLKYGCDGIVIDPYNEVSAIRKGSMREDEHIRDFIAKCKRFCRLHDVVVWVVAHPTKLAKGNDGNYPPPTAYDISGASHWHNQSDAVLTIHRDFDDESLKVITRKIREQGLYGKIGQATFKYNYLSRLFEEHTEVYDNDVVDLPNWQ